MWILLQGTVKGTFMKPQSNKCIVRSHKIYSDSTKLQSQHRLPSNCVSWKLCCNLICIQKKWWLQEYIWMPTCLHTHAQKHTCPLLHMWIWTPVVIQKQFPAWLSMQAKARCCALKTKRLSNIWYHFWMLGNNASSIIVGVIQTGWRNLSSSAKCLPNGLSICQKWVGATVWSLTVIWPHWETFNLPNSWRDDRPKVTTAIQENKGVCECVCVLF